ncbi:hemophore-related protein [Mycobacterium uberis]|uniref:Hemophore-related protein n=1 Tax=Mycobacterium uberis TaxID=2162698 RepID=A0A3E1HDR4_9MYCO|nr:hemophore-related protein [Mycobacterium uberis]RFD24592.1 hemophore-related protein [Mycobacterium uberis]
MVRSLVKLAATLGGVALALAAATGIASADPLDGVIGTHCNYRQVMAALNAADPGAAAEFNSSPMAQSYLSHFLAASPTQREQMVQQIKAMPGAAQYLGLVDQVAGTCSNY